MGVSVELLVSPVPLVKMVSAELLVPLDLLEDPVALEPPAKMVSMELLVPLALKVIVELLDSTEDFKEPPVCLVNPDPLDFLEPLDSVDPQDPSDQLALQVSLELQARQAWSDLLADLALQAPLD